MSLPTDSDNYDLLTKGIRLSAATDGLTCEIGLRAGGGTEFIINALSECAPNKTHIAIDPYGHILYEHKEAQFVRLDYTNDMRDECLKNLYALCQQKKISFLFFNMTDLDFFDYYSKGIPVYNIERELKTTYSFIHFDGPHAIDPLKTEIDFFMPRINKGACFVFDDVEAKVFYDHSVIDEYLKEKGFTLIEQAGKKALYQW